MIQEILFNCAYQLLVMFVNTQKKDVLLNLPIRRFTEDFIPRRPLGFYGRRLK